jgi:hypothetical protein
MRIENPYINYGSNLGGLGDSQADMLAMQDAEFGVSPDYSSYPSDSGQVYPSQGVSPWVIPASISTPDSPVQPSNNSSLLDTLVQTVGKVAGTYLTTQAAVDVARAKTASPIYSGVATAANPYGWPVNSLGQPYNPSTGLVYNPYSTASAPSVPGITGSLTGSSNTLLLIGLALAAVVLMR